MRMIKKSGVFVSYIKGTDNNNSTQLKSLKSERLIMYEDVECVCTSINKGKNYVEYIQTNDKFKSSMSANRATLGEVIETLPSYFVKINRSEIINVFHIIGRSKNRLHLFTKNNTYVISRNLIKKVNEVINQYFHSNKKEEV